MKRLGSILLAVAIFAAVQAFPAFASDASEAEVNAQPRSALCFECGQGEMQFVKEYYSSWITVDYVPCVSGAPFYNDEKQIRRHYQDYECDFCHIGDTLIDEEERIVHSHGW